MRTGRKVALIAAVGTFAVAVPAAAKPPGSAPPTDPAHPSHPAHPSDQTTRSHPSASHKCVPHTEAYTASGPLMSWNASQTGTGYTGTITVHVTKANHHAAGAKGTDVTYTLTNARVTFGAGATTPTTGDPVKVIGKTTVLANKCDQSGFTPTITIRKVNVHRAHT
jgi:hypothetical protein